MPGEGLKVLHRATVSYFQVLTFPPQDVFDTSDIGGSLAATEPIDQDICLDREFTIAGFFNPDIGFKPAGSETRDTLGAHGGRSAVPPARANR